MNVRYPQLISIGNLFQAWCEFRKGKRKRADGQLFERHLEDQPDFANIYLNELDQFIKYNLQIRYYLRYADDFLFLSESKRCLEELINPLGGFLKEHLKLELYPHKILFRKLDWGIDFLGDIILPHYRLLRTKTKRRIFRKLISKIGSVNFNQSRQLYLGFLSHENAYKLTRELKDQVWFTPTPWWLGVWW